MYKLNEETKNNINNIIQRKFGISYEEFNELDFDEQQKLIEQHKKNSDSKIPVMIGSGEHSIFVSVKKDERVMLDDGTVIIAGITPEKEKEILNKKLDDIFNTTLVTKIKRKIKRKL